MLAIDGMWDGTLTTETTETPIPWSLRHRLRASVPGLDTPVDEAEMTVGQGSPRRVHLLEAAPSWLVAIVESAPAGTGERRRDRLLLELRRCGDRLVGRCWRLSEDGRHVGAGRVRGTLRQ